MTKPIGGGTPCLRGFSSRGLEENRLAPKLDCKTLFFGKKTSPTTGPYPSGSAGTGPLDSRGRWLFCDTRFSTGTASSPAPAHSQRSLQHRPQRKGQGPCHEALAGCAVQGVLPAGSGAAGAGPRVARGRRLWCTARGSTGTAPYQT